MPKNLIPAKIVYLHENAGYPSSVANILEKSNFNFNIQGVTSQNEFSLALKDPLPDIILAEDNSTGFSAMAAFELLKNKGLQIPFIIISESISEETAIEMFNKGVDDLILKSNLEGIGFSIRNAISRKKLERDNLELKQQSQGKTIQNKNNVNQLDYRYLFDNNLDGILLTRTNGEVYAANAAACKLFGMPESEICALGRKGLCDLNDPRLKEALTKRETEGSVYTEINMIRKDGTVFPAEISSSVFQLGNESVPRTSLIIRDVTSKNTLLDKLQTSEIRYKSLFNYNPLPVFMFNEDTLEIIDVNPAACTHYGYTKEEFVGMLLQQIRPPSEIPYLKKIINNHKENTQDSWHSTAIHSKKDGTLIDVEIKSHRFTLDDISCIVAVCTDVTEIKQNIKKLTDFTEKLKLAEKIAKLGYWEHNLIDNSVYCSNEIFSIFGLDKNQNFSSEQFIEFIHPEDMSEFLKEQEALYNGEKEHDFQYRIILKNEDVKWVNARAKLIKSPSGEITKTTGTLQDITSQKLVTEELVKSEARYKSLFNSQTNYFVRINMQGEYTYCNHKFKNEFGWLFPHGEPKGHSALIDVMEYHHQDIADITKKMVKSPNETFQLELDKQVFDAEPKTTLWDMTYLNVDKGAGEIQCVGIDISSRVKVIRENKFQADLLNKIGQGIIAANSKGKVTYWNNAAEKMYGWKSEEAMGIKLDHLLSLDRKSFFNKENLMQFKKGNNVSGEELVAGKDKIKIPIQFISSPILNSKNEFKGFICVTSDISDLKKSETQLKKLNKELNDYTKELVSANEGLEQFSYIVSHNLRAPVANILGIAHLLENDDNTEDIEETLRTEMFANVGRLDEVVRDLKFILNVKSNFTQKREWVDLNLMVKDIIASNNTKVIKNEVTVACDFNSMKKIKTVKSYLYSILFNLISNSIKYRKKDVAPLIKISSAIQKDKIILTIEDNGMGIDLSKRKEQVFGLYKRFHNHVEGKGMGLFMVKTQVQILGGDIEVESTAGVGSKFIISLKKEQND